jgi:hypothetical protein
MKRVLVLAACAAGLLADTAGATSLRVDQERQLMKRCQMQQMLSQQAGVYNAMFLEMSEGNQTKETVETEIDPDCPEKYTTNTALPHAQLPDDGKGNFTHTPKRLKKMNDDEMSEMRKSGRELEKAMLNETIAKFWLDRETKELKDRVSAAIVCMEGARIATREAYMSFNRSETIRATNSMLNEGINKTECSQEKVDFIIPQRKKVNAVKAKYDVAKEIRVSTEKQLVALDKRRFESAETMCTKLEKEAAIVQQQVIVRLAKIANDTKAVKTAVANPQPGQDVDAMMESIVLGNGAAAARKQLLDAIRKQAVHVCERNRVLRIERGLPSNETDPEIFKTVSHSIIYRNLNDLRIKAEKASETAKKMRMRAGLYKITASN